ncbi:WPP domain-interacting protein 1-like [Chenopodium quinoa]|nr:WPP domain-interacting protein 1-like [Chenopodium quinoa]
MDLESELTVVVGADANQRNGNHLLDSDQPTGSADPVEADTNHHSTGIEIQESRSLTNKGYGLKKWRRIRRKDVVITKETELEKEKEKEKEKDYDSDSTTGRMLKRGSANILNENDVSSMSPNHNNLAAVVVDTFNVGADSGNSEDSHSHSHRSSSKSSTAASHPKLSLRASSGSTQAHHPHLNQRRPNKPNLNQPQPQPQPQTQTHPDPIKKQKPRETSPLSSMESDSRSSFRDHLPTPNPSSFDADDAANPHPLPPPSSQQQLPSTLTGTTNFALSSDSSDQLSSTAYHGNTKLPTDRDPLLDSILLLQSAQLALQTEVQKFGEIGKGICSLCDDSDKTSGVPVPSLSVDPLVYMENASDGWSEFNHAYLSKIVQTLERQLNEAEGSLKEKEQRIAELETMRSMESPQERVRSTMEQQTKRYIEMEAELQDLFKKKLEAEVQSVVIARSSKDLSVLVEDKILREQISLSKEQAQSPKMTVSVENKAVMLQGQAEKSDALYGGILGGEEIQKMQKRVVKFTKCLTIQLVLLVLVFALFVMQLVPKSAVVVPT